MFDPLLILLGLVVGLLVGFTGMGGGALMAPGLIFWFNIPPVVAVGTDLAYSAVTKAFGAFQHLRSGNVNIGLALRLAVGSIPGALLAVGMAEWVKAMGQLHHDLMIKKALGIILVFVGGLLLFQLLWHSRRSHSWPDKMALLNPVMRYGLDIGAAIVVGFLVGLTSVGSGSLIVAWLSLTSLLPARMVVGTDLLNAFLLTTTAALAHFQAGNIDTLLTVNLLLGSIPGILIGTHLTLRVPNVALRGCLAFLLLAIGVRLFRP
ncbi:Sulfite exporter TauE/SafE [Candidatus Methylomirabilis lanthanidiphila]|uniref:Probable membrane transporter protein n=1 Tax=Candidatus Methylomirabilis lanthanidiphila TaxID=2211376 RepID=A0A564ZL06_9BACT|nr:sulfite exporter TauE/SafE family protein [Candidatus Methylomirabilis lanthanidiphila]VUZ86015.1 Sulfite exporter TauE/SafE [Candidatus Methylomirabilis lanthanidiphila]